MNPGGRRRLFSNIIFLQSFQFGPAPNASLGNYLGLPLPSRKIREFFPFDVSHTANLPAKTGQSKTSKILYFFRGRTRQSSRVVGAQNPTSIISSIGSLLKRSYLHLEPAIHPSWGFGNDTWVPPASLPSYPALKIGGLLTTASKI